MAQLLGKVVRFVRLKAEEFHKISVWARSVADIDERYWGHPAGELLDKR